MRESIKQILMRRDDLTGEEADDLISDAREDLEAMLSEGDMEGAERVYEYVETETVTEREEPARDPWIGVPQNREWGGEEVERRG